MPTDNPKISAYVPQLVYDTFKQFQDERGISMSQAVIVILAEYFGIQQELKEFIEGSVVGGVTLSRIEEIEQSIEQLTLMFYEGQNPLKSEPNSSLLSELEKWTDKMSRIETRLDQVEYWRDKLEKFDESPTINEVKEIDKSEEMLEVTEDSQLELISSLSSEPLVESIVVVGRKLSELRFKLAKDTLAGHKRKDSVEELIKWTKESDPDGIGWMPNPNGDGYIPEENTTSELLSKLQIWIEENIPKN